MPLNDGQKQVIESTLDHLLNFSENQDSFKEELTALKAAIVQALKPAPQDNNDKYYSLYQIEIGKKHPFYWIRQCLLDPDLYFQILRKHKAPEEWFSVFEVKEYVIEFITTILEKNKGKDILKDWDKDELEAFIPLEDLEATIEERKMQEENIEPHPYDVLQVNKKIYTLHLGPFDRKYFYNDTQQRIVTYLKPTVIIEIAINGQNLRHSSPFGEWTLAPNFLKDYEEDAFAETFKLQAEKVAENFALEWALKYLIQQNIIIINDPIKITNNDHAASRTEEEDNGDENHYIINTRPIERDLNDADSEETVTVVEEDSSTSEATDEEEDNITVTINNVTDYSEYKLLCEHAAVKLMMTNNYYFNQLLSKNISIFQLILLDGKKAELLIDSLIVHALENNFFNFDQVTQLSLQKLSNLFHPGIMDLIAKKIYSLDSPIHKPHHLTLMTDHFYYSLLSEQKLSLEDISPDITEERVRFLRLPPIINLIRKQTFSFQDAKTLPLNFAKVARNFLYQSFLNHDPFPIDDFKQMKNIHYTFLSIKKVAYLITKDILTCKDILNLSTLQIYRFTMYPFLLEWIEPNLISLMTTGSVATSIKDICACVYAKRLEAIILGKSYFLKQKADDANNLLDELPTIMAYFRTKPSLSLINFKISIAHSLLLLIKMRIDNLAANHPNLFAFKRINQIINIYTTSSETPHWLSCLQRCIEYTKESSELKKINPHALLFPKNLISNNSLLSFTDFATGLQKLAPFCHDMSLSHLAELEAPPVNTLSFQRK